MHRVEIVTYGLYKPGQVLSQRAVADGEQTVDNVVSQGEMFHVKTTEQVPVSRGVVFGIQYRIVGTPSDGEVDVEVNHIHPLMTPTDRPALSRQTYRARKPMGQVHRAGYDLVLPCEMVYGQWTVQVISGGKTVEQTFSLVKQEAANNQMQNIGTNAPNSDL